ncbi:asparagine synthase (glutamine-hydrolyzing) [Haloarcula sp. CBA1130]|uniref:asparagine synthase (glutamine-hydrolyzing) n=1 Tax=unclassified Haloarcula TaxID=2624677 RepID=UPI001244B3F3|nr:MULTISPECIES: asparagine synthase (glutamine-hydrolyzing) [unclassified Haloarcula]KAA9398352.1 asparagine synthase (glutamine-hydrolyzing) [Haloarcula sp. CBA1129]KAA9402053.1 asparagine synthase (glutamine-hydrolyzing) [Haloarcula sp. CBA1130]
MCGIVGAINTDITAGVERCLSHRGPDSQDHYTTTVDGADIYLGNTRLSIIGLGEQGRQPMHDDKVSITFNGEVYNYRELRERLQSAGYAFDTTTDTEVLLKGYREWGLDSLLQRLHGMFGFALLDENTGSLYVCRDQLGVKPLYFVDDGERFIFASEIKAILSGTDVDAVIRRDRVGEYLANHWVYEPDTLFEDIYKLPAGTYVSIDCSQGSTEHHRYWDPISDTKPPTASRDDLSTLLETTIDEQMRSDVSVGMYLSGGIDSSLIAHYATDIDPDLTALHLRDDERNEGAEYRNLQRLDDSYPFDLHSFTPDQSMVDLYKEMIYYLDEPIADPAIIPAYLLAREASDRDIRVMLSGMGGDEIFAGYRRMKVIRWQRYLRWLWPGASAAATLYPDRDSDIRRNLGRTARYLRSPTPDNYHSLSYYFSREEIGALLDRPDWHEDYADRIDELLGDRNFDSRAEQLQFLDLRGFLASHNFMYADKASMVAGVEVRVPLASHHIAAEYFRQPLAEKMADGLKTPLREVARGLFDDEFVEYKKEGFGFPIEKILDTEEMRDELSELVNDDRMQRLFNTDYVEKIIDDHYREAAQNAMKIWNVYTLWLWLMEFDVTVPESS